MEKDSLNETTNAFTLMWQCGRVLPTHGVVVVISIKPDLIMVYLIVYDYIVREVVHAERKCIC